MIKSNKNSVVARALPVVLISSVVPKKRDIPLKVEKEGNFVSNVEGVLNVLKMILSGCTIHQLSL